LILSACGGSSPSSSATNGTTGGGTGGKQLVYFIFNGYTPPYFAPMAKGVQDASKHFPGLNIKILGANGSASTEINQIKQAQAAGAKAIVLNAIDGSVTGAAKQASSSVPIITIDRDVTDPSARIAFIGDNDKKLGKQLATSCIQGLTSSGLKKPWHVIDLQGTQGASTSVDREAGIQTVLKPLEKKGDLSVLLNQSADFATDKAQTLISESLAKSTNVQAVIASNDAMALGAINALKSHNITAGKQVIVCGADAQPESLAAIKSGTQFDTVTHAPYVEAFWAVEAIDAYLTKQTKPDANRYPNGVVLLPQVVVTKKNVAKVGAWGTPQTVSALPYGGFKSYPAG
jgi:ABC-type sugar transport system substrate-binding protein